MIKVPYVCLFNLMLLTGEMIDLPDGYLLAPPTPLAEAVKNYKPPRLLVYFQEAVLSLQKVLELEPKHKDAIEELQQLKARLHPPSEQVESEAVTDFNQID